MSRTQHQSAPHCCGSAASSAAVSTSQGPSQHPNQQSQSLSSHHALLIREAEALYKIELAGFFRALDDETKLIQMEMTVRQNVLKGLKSKAKNTSFSWESLQQLQQTLSSWFNNGLILFRAKLDREKGVDLVRTIITKVAPTYHQKMQNFFRAVDFTEPSGLFRLHQKISDELLQLYENPRTSSIQNSTTDSGTRANLNWSQNNEYTAEMLNLFKSYQEANCIKYEEKSLAIGIQLGTTNIRVATCTNGTVNMIKTMHGKSTIPNCISFIDNEHVLVGEEAEEHFFQSPNLVAIFGIKQIIGRRFEEMNLPQNPMTKLWPIQLIRGENDSQPKIQVNVPYKTQVKHPKGNNNAGRMESFKPEEFYPEEILSIILQHATTTAEAYLRIPIKTVVISVPSHYTDSQRQAVKDAGEIAGIKRIKLINVTTAAALAFHETTIKRPTTTPTITSLGQDVDLEYKKTVLVFQLGAGELEVAVMKIKRGEIIVIANGSDPDVKGQDFDDQMTQFIIDSFKRSHKIQLDRGLDSEDFQQKLLAIKRSIKMRNEVEKHKKHLSSSSESVVSFSDIEQEFLNLDLKFKITPELMENLNQEKFSRCLKLVQWTLDEVKMDKNEIDKVILAGGSTRIPSLRRILLNFFGGDREHIFHMEMMENPEVLAVIGAASQACMLREEMICGRNPMVKISDVLSYSIVAQRFQDSKNPCDQLPQNEIRLHIPRNFPLPCAGGSHLDLGDKSSCFLVSEELEQNLEKSHK